MGACQYEELSHGKTAKEAFHRAVEQAQYEYGHGGYTGTIAEKCDFTVFDLPPRVMAGKVVAALGWAALHMQFIDSPECVASYNDRTIVTRARREWEWLVSKFDARTVREMVRLYDDKWGPAVGFQVTGKVADRYRLYHPMKRGERVFLFCGFASS